MMSAPALAPAAREYAAPLEDAAQLLLVHGRSSAALQAFRGQPHRFDLVLTDEAMPDLMGTELAQRIRRIAPDVPIILMSGHGGAQLTQKALAVGAQEVLHKPLQRRDLAESLARVLGAAHPDNSTGTQRVVL